MTEPDVVVDTDQIAGAMVPVDPALIHAAPTTQVLELQVAYQALCAALLEPSDYQTIGDKQFRKKSGWRKLAVAFNVSTELLSETEIRGHRNRIEEVKCLVRASAPNGRFQDGIGVCSIYERCCDPTTCDRWEVYRDGRPTGHVHCGDTCNGRQHFSNPAHDIPSTAMTRATNRAQADLFGMGEVSAEEVMDNGQGQWHPGETAGGGPASPAGPSRRGSTAPSGPKPAAEAQKARIVSLMAEIGAGEALLHEILPDHEEGTELLFSEARKLIDTLEQRKKEANG